MAKRNQQPLLPPFPGHVRSAPFRTVLVIANVKPAVGRVERHQKRSHPPSPCIFPSFQQPLGPRSTINRLLIEGRTCSSSRRTITSRMRVKILPTRSPTCFPRFEPLLINQNSHQLIYFLSRNSCQACTIITMARVSNSQYLSREVSIADLCSGLSSPLLC